MRGLIKSAAAAAPPYPIRAFGAAVEATPSDTSTREMLLQNRIAELEEALVENEERHEQELEHAREEGARLALEERSDVEERAIRELATIGEQANETWKKRLQTWEAFSIRVARAVLQKVFADATERAKLVESCIRHRIERLDGQSIALIRVSGKDFPDASALAEIGNGVEIASDPRLGSGACVIDLKLGRIELGLDAQWTRIDDLLESLEQESAAC